MLRVRRHDQRQFGRGRCELLVDCVQPVSERLPLAAAPSTRAGDTAGDYSRKSNDGYYCTSGQSNADYFKLARFPAASIPPPPRRPVPACPNPLRWRLRVSRWQVFFGTRRFKRS